MKITRQLNITAGGRHAWFATDTGRVIRKPLDAQIEYKKYGAETYENPKLIARDIIVKWMVYPYILIAIIILWFF
jgi:hypothetical protein